MLSQQAKLLYTNNLPEQQWQE